MADVCEKKFAEFIRIIQEECPYELPEEVFPHIKKALITSLLLIPSTTDRTTTDTNTTSTSRAKRAPTAYNVFMKSRMIELKEQSVEASVRRTRINDEWKGLSKEDKEEWKHKAQSLPSDQEPPGGPSKPKSKSRAKSKVSGETGTDNPKKLNAYQKFMKEMLPKLKTDPEFSDVKGTDRMKAVSVLWKKLTDSEREEYKTK
jgi:hypothetical protein